MDAERYARVTAVFLATTSWPPQHQGAVVEALADGDPAVRAEVLSLLGFHDAREHDHGPAPEGVARWRDPPRTIAAATAWLAPIAAALGARAAAHGAVDRAHVSDGPDGAQLREPSEADRVQVGLTSAPEQLVATLGPVGPWTDVYQLARLLSEAIVGHPVGAETPAAAIARSRDEAAAPTPAAHGVALAEPIARVFARALALRPIERYQDVPRFWSALQRAVTASSVGGAPTLPVAPPRSRRRLAVALVVGVTVAIATAAAGLGLAR